MKVINHGIMSLNCQFPFISYYNCKSSAIKCYCRIFHPDTCFSLDTEAPKHGKEDPKNEPHVGGNTWAGGTGGRDTAGLGGKGGPYRLDKGHKVHQVTTYKFTKVYS